MNIEFEVLSALEEYCGDREPSWADPDLLAGLIFDTREHLELVLLAGELGASDEVLAASVLRVFRHEDTGYDVNRVLASMWIAARSADILALLRGEELPEQELPGRKDLTRFAKQFTASEERGDQLAEWLHKHREELADIIGEHSPDGGVERILTSFVYANPPRYAGALAMEGLAMWLVAYRHALLPVLLKGA